MIWSQIEVTATPANWPRLVLAVFSGLGILPFLVAVRARVSGSHLRETPLWLALISLAILFLVGSEDKARLFLYALPALVVLALKVIEDVLKGREPRRPWLWIAVALCFHFYLGHHLTRMGTFQEYLDRMVPVYATVDAVLAGFARIACVAAIFAIATAVSLRQTAPARRS